MHATVKLYRRQGMDASLTSVPIDMRGARRVTFANVYDSATPSGLFTYEVSGHPQAGNNPSHADAGWEAVTPSSEHGAHPDGAAAGKYSASFADIDGRFIRQKWTRVAGTSSDYLTTHVNLED